MTKWDIDDWDIDEKTFRRIIREEIRVVFSEVREIERLQAALREIKALPVGADTRWRTMEIVDAALSGKGET